MISFGKLHVFLQPSWIRLFGGNRASLHLETPKLQEVFLSKLTELSQGNNVLHGPALNIDGLFVECVECHMFLQIS
jgi:hypothetical protein